MNQLALPVDTLAERAVVSACLLVPECLAVVRDMLRPDQLFDPSARLVLQSVYEIDDAGSRVDPVTLTGRMRDAGRLEVIGGSKQLVEFFDATPDPTHVAEHASIVTAKHRLRSVIAACKLHAAAAYGDVGPIDDYCSTVERDILDATDPGTRVDAPQTIGELIGQELPKITERQDPKKKLVLSGTKTGIHELNHLLCGGYDNSLYIVAGRPGQGKSAYATGNALAVAESGKSAVIFSLEMPKDQIAMRILAMASLVSYNAIKSQRLNPEEWSSVLQAAEHLSKLPLSIQYRGGAHVTQIRSTLRREFARLKRSHGAEPGIGVIDYAQLVKGDRPKGASRDEEVGSVSRYCMSLPAEFKCPMLLLAQLNREVEKRPNKRPQLSDLRESGSLEQDAYGILFLYRDEYYNEETADKGIAELIVAKNRNGETGTVKCKFDGPCTRFSSLNEQLYRDLDDLDTAIGGY